jgi:SAM-dependent methyltransferase
VLRRAAGRSAFSPESAILVLVVSFTCNICGAYNQHEQFATEPASCACGSNVRIRALIHLLAMELFNQSLTLTEFPKLRAIRGLGMSDHEGYARILAEKFDYTNTYYDREPRFDFTAAHPELYGRYDFILSADVIEHIAPPVERALEEACRLLKPHGVLGITVFCHPSDQLREHFPGLGQYRVVPLGGTMVLINRRADGSLEARDDLIFHGGSGATLEMREYGATALRRQLLGAGFREVSFLEENIPSIGVYFDHDVSQPLIARKAPFVMEKSAISQMIDQWRAGSGGGEEDHRQAAILREQVRMARESRWLRLGRKLGLGPKF